VIDDLLDDLFKILAGCLGLIIVGIIAVAVALAIGWL
jgi:hypothetical protein